MREQLCPSPTSQVAATIIDGQAVIVMADTGQLAVLNEVGSRLWELCDGSHTIASMIDIIADEFDIDAGQAGSDVNGFLDRLIEIQAVLFKECI